jgi:hypothetical protein
MSAALEIVRRKRLIFTLTTGRSGTEYLARALGAFREVEARHEPKPTFGSAFRTVAAAPGTAREFWLAHKLPRIARGSRPVYAETSHLACKGFLESAVELGLTMTWVRLHRPAREVAASLWQLGTIPGRSYGGVKYYLAPFDRGVRLALDAARVERLDDYQLCYWYCLELEARAEELVRRFPAVPCVRRELDQLGTLAALEELGRELGLAAPSPLGRVQLAALAGRRVNRKLDRKRAPEPEPGRLELLEAELRELVEA